MTGVKRKERDLPTRISMNYNQFVIKTRNIATSKSTSLYFKTLDEAVAAKDAERAKWAEHKRNKAARPRAEKHSR